MTEGFDQFVAHDLDNLLAGRKSGQDFLPDRLGPDAVDKFLDHLEIDVGFKQRQPDFTQRLVNVLLGQLGLTAKALERALQFLLKILKHKGKKLFYQS